MTVLAGTDVSRETIERLEQFGELTIKWNPRINLVAKSTIPDLWSRHILDSVQLYQYAPAKPKKWLDIGSGGGFPGIVMAVVAAEKSPETTFTLIESDQRKSTFLRSAARELGLNLKVIASRIEETESQTADVISARALSALTDLFPFINRHLVEDGVAILPKGRSYQDEINAAKRDWHFDVHAHQSMTDHEARVLVVKGIIRD